MTVDVFGSLQPVIRNKSTNLNKAEIGQRFTCYQEGTGEEGTILEISLEDKMLTWKVRWEESGKIVTVTFILL